MQAVGGEYIRFVACDTCGREVFVCGAACGTPCIVVGDDQSLFIGKCLREDMRQAVENTDADLHGYGICRRGQSGGNTLAVTHRMVFLL